MEKMLKFSDLQVHARNVTPEIPRHGRDVTVMLISEAFRNTYSPLYK